jgi:tetratricopeptide (TPR) repeat protein
MEERDGTYEASADAETRPVRGLESADETMPAQPEPAAPRSLLEMLGWPQRRAAARQERLEHLNLGIELYPEEPANYVLRGELFEETGQHVLAAEDYQRALELAQEHVMTNRWGFIAQAVQDRAMMGLRRVNNSE